MTISIADKKDMKDVFALREEVFIKEQNVPAEIELDCEDENATHIIARDGDTTIGCARIIFSEHEAHIGRFAVKKAWRGKGIGANVFRFITEYCESRGCTRIWFNAQLHAVGFYEKLGYKKKGKIFIEAGIEHIEMEKVK